MAPARRQSFLTLAMGVPLSARFAPREKKAKTADFSRCGQITAVACEACFDEVRVRGCILHHIVRGCF
jgi:hypothetical protein